MKSPRTIWRELPPSTRELTIDIIAAIAIGIALGVLAAAGF